MQSLTVNSSRDESLDKGDAPTGRLPFVRFQGIGRAVGQAVAAFNAAVGLGKYQFWLHRGSIALSFEFNIWFKGLGFAIIWNYALFGLN
jgi:hypothetical protein